MPITKAEAQGVTRAFVRDYPGALELAYKFREDAAELYGPRAAEVPADMKGGYVPKETLHAGRAYRGRVDDVRRAPCRACRGSQHRAAVKRWLQ